LNPSRKKIATNIRKYLNWTLNPIRRKKLEMTGISVEAFWKMSQDEMNATIFRAQSNSAVSKSRARKRLVKR